MLSTKELINFKQKSAALKIKVGSRIIVREDFGYMRKNVTAKCYGGNYSRKKKLLDCLKEGKKMLRKIGKVEVGRSFYGYFKKIIDDMDEYFILEI